MARAEERVFNSPWKWVLNKGHSGLGNTPFKRKDPSKQKVQSKRIGFQANAYALKVRLGTTINPYLYFINGLGIRSGTFFS